MSTVVVLTRDYAFWGQRPLRDALRLIVKGKVEIVASDESRMIHAGVSRDGAVFKLPAPLVVRLLDFVGIKVKREEIRFSKEAVYERDDNVCQYYHYDPRGRRFLYRTTEEDRTIDHIVPKVRGGENSFLNCVTACRWHNEVVKRGRSLKDVGLELVRQPFVPRLRRGDWVVLRFAFNPSDPAHEALRKAGIA